MSRAGGPEAGLRFEGPGEVLRPRLSLLVGAAVLFATSLVLVRLGAPGWGAVVEQGLAAWLVAAFAWRAYRSSVKGIVHADASGLRVGDATVATRARIASAFLLAPETPVVRVMLHRAPSLDVKLESEEKALALLRALGMGTGEAIATFRAVYGGLKRTMLVVGGVSVWGVVAGIVTNGVLHGGSLASGVFIGVLAVTWVVAYRRMAVRVDVGSDGVLLRRLWGERFVSYGAMTGVVATGRNSLLVGLKGEPDVRLTIGGWGDHAQLRDAAVERMDEARSVFLSTEGTEAPETLVAPGGRPAERWLREVRALARAKDYRETRLDRERLWRVVDDAGAPAATRVGAALALSAFDDPEGTQRLRVAAEACVEPKLRIALVRVADGASDAEVEEALAPLLEPRGEGRG